ncbi:MAG: proline iminopeptidase-family hydrolase [Candidatus Marinimicrobia bacterium]|jgi:proline iminopeptidase|nr:proline iminopeptidase-family hydrolase [Candidatus Neomarinimicrobiota bacterium]|tara:strand:- start:4550 stop:5503 length:954 start_codon:yes stop_codon:yes gene_type:complete
MKKSIPFFIFIFIIGCTNLSNNKAKMISIDGGHKVWTKKSGNNDKIKLLLLHGGPGATHEYFKILDNYLPQSNIEYYYYDQFGSHNSDPSTNPSDWTIDRFVEEVESVRKSLGLNSSNFYLLGHSWGGLLAMEYALKYQKNLKGLIISNMMASIPDYNNFASNVLGPQMPSEVLAEIRKLEANKDFGNPRYMELLIPYHYQEHILRIPADQWPEEVNNAFANINQEMYVAMQGPSEFGASGLLEFWDVKDRLSEIKTPTLVIGATHDTMDPKHMEWMANEFPNGSFLLCPNGSHMAMWDDPDNYANGIISFLNKTNN